MESKTEKSPKSVNLLLLLTLKYPPMVCKTGKSPKAVNLLLLLTLNIPQWIAKQKNLLNQLIYYYSSTLKYPPMVC